MLPLHAALAGVQIVGVPWRSLAMMALAIFGDLVGPTLPLLIRLRLRTPIGNGLRLHVTHDNIPPWDS
jgi:hypothetical protein